MKMLNVRQVTPKFILAGGWQNVPEDTLRLAEQNIGAVLDLQFNPFDDVRTSVPFISEELGKYGILYTYRQVYDGDFGQNMVEFWKDTNSVLNSFITMLPADKYIVIKCSGGMSRSPSTLIAFLISTGLTYEEAYSIVRSSDKSAAWPIGILPFFTSELRKL